MMGEAASARSALALIASWTYCDRPGVTNPSVTVEEGMFTHVANAVVLDRAERDRVLRWAEPLPAKASTPEFVEHCAARLTRLSALHHWLHAQVAP